MAAEIHGRPVRSGTARGLVAMEGAAGPGAVLACEDLGPYLGPEGHGLAALIGGSASRIVSPPDPAGPPAVDRVDLELLRPGDSVVVDGDRGTVRLSGVRPVEVVTAFLQRDDGRILLLRRSAKVGSFQGRWAGVSGFLEEPTPERQAVKEIGEETGILPRELERVATAPPIYARDLERLFVVHPFRFHVPPVEVHLDWEHTEAEWVEPSAIRERSTVPRLAQAWEAVAGTGSLPGGARTGKR